MALPSRQAALARIRELVVARRVQISKLAQTDTENLGYDLDDVCECLGELDDSDYDSAVEASEKREGGVVCIFRKQFNGDELYVKVCINPGNPGSLYVISFKLYGSPR